MPASFTRSFPHRSAHGFRRPRRYWRERSCGRDKGAAIAAVLAEPPFAGRAPIFTGDDVTDEDGFAEVSRRGGIAIRVGPQRRSRAAYVLPNVQAVHCWQACRGAETTASQEDRLLADVSQERDEVGLKMIAKQIMARMTRRFLQTKRVWIQPSCRQRYPLPAGAFCIAPFYPLATPCRIRRCA